ncbi:PEP-CTERM sorting domain-containing protein [Oceanibacterium hippocampi]|uniref:Ice-binding protein C-terminal domain-containing protein n=1 Tax=Oceanibacterium hippocampi TaxID=745714 RepID=A0A1Y5S2G4_9PROT|nr:PEP-CTERM sorting domain-containing protein [Oceanibacterium hippocampi]SLN30569.1 hypothetical protein OCH7691_01071 [Oceanibacterium hippocampi]
MITTTLSTGSTTWSPRRLFAALAIAIAPLFAAGQAGAVVSQVGIDAFGPDTVQGGPPLSPGNLTIVGHNVVNDGTVWGPASNPGVSNIIFDLRLTLNFAAPVTRVGFYYGGNQSNSSPVNIKLGGTTNGSFIVTSQFGPPDGINNWIFYGFEDTGGIDAVVFDWELNNEFAVGIHSIIYETDVVETPAPAALGLFGLGLIGLGLVRRKRG